MVLKMLENEYWWGGCVNLGNEMPFSAQTNITIDLKGDFEYDDQFAPLLLSNKGRYIWSDKYFKGTIKNGVISLVGETDFEVKEGYENLRGAYLAAMEAHFPFDGKLPNEMFWKAPHYNTWVELGTEQTTSAILEYAKGILDNGLPAGVLMIDGGWQEDYGIYEFFNQRKVPDPKLLIDELHRLGFKVMLWVSPIISSAGTRFKYLHGKGYLVKDAKGDVAIRKWWSGYSAVLDFTNPEAVEWMHKCLHSLMDKYGVDGFKFDAGDCYFYADDDITFKQTSAREQTYAFNELGEKYEFNEFRAAWRFGGRAIVARQNDKSSNWDNHGINTLIPHTIMQGLMGYAYNCPDMVGGVGIGHGKAVDEELVIRWSQANALMGMMQMSMSPWKILSGKSLRIVKNALKLHAEYGEYMYTLAKNASKTGEPIVRHMCYEFPLENFETVNDQFMLGSNILVAPVVEKGCTLRKIKLPKGKWKCSDGTVLDGNQTVPMTVTDETLLYFKKI